jgi:hypothetical protein
MDRVSDAGWLPLEVETVPEARERAAASPVARLLVAHEASEETRQKRTDGPAFFSRQDTRFAEQVRVDSQRHFGLHGALLAQRICEQF